MDLATKAGVSQSHLSQILKGRRHVYVDQLEAICEALGLDVSDVIAEAWEDSRPDRLKAAQAMRSRLDDIARPTARPTGERSTG